MMKVGDMITRVSHGERAVVRITRVIDANTVEVEPVSVAGYTAIGVPTRMRIKHGIPEDGE